MPPTTRRGRGAGTTGRRSSGRRRGSPPPPRLDLVVTEREIVERLQFKCPCCEDVFQTEAEVTTHKYTHSELYEYECGQCEELACFSGLDQLKMHFYNVHVEGGQRGTLTKRTDTQSRVVGGETEEDGGGKSSDDDDREDFGGDHDPHDDGVDECFVTGDGSVVDEGDFAVGDQRRSNGGIADVKKYPCEHCDKSYSFKGDLTIHLRTHTGETPYVCAECGKGFSIYRSMVDHVRRHNAEYRYFCEVVGCGKGFVKKQDRDRHEVRAHVPPALQDRQDNQCHVCGKYFTQKVHLKEHLLIHSGGQKPHVCELCGKGFWAIGQLRVHLRSQKHGGTGVSHYNKKKPKKFGPKAKPGRKPKSGGGGVPQDIIKTDDGGDTRISDSSFQCLLGEDKKTSVRVPEAGTHTTSGCVGNNTLNNLPPNHAPYANQRVDYYGNHAIPYTQFQIAQQQQQQAHVVNGSSWGRGLLVGNSSSSAYGHEVLNQHGGGNAPPVVLSLQNAFHLELAGGK